MISSSSDAQDVVAAMRAADDSLRSGELIGTAVAPLTSQWGSLLGARALGPQDQRALVDGATALVDGASLVLGAAESSVPLSGGLVPVVSGSAVEFGSSRPGLPPVTRGGRVALPAAHELRDQYVTTSYDAIETTYQTAGGD